MADTQRIAGDALLYRLLVQRVTDYAIYLLDAAGTVMNWNAGAERAKGYRAEEIVGRHFSRFYGEEDRRAGLPQRALATALATGKFEGEGWRLRKGGSRFWAHVVIDPIRDEGGTLVGFAKITRDLTEQKRSADRTRRATENLDLALSNISQGLALFDAQERMVLCNGRFRELLALGEVTACEGTTLTDLLWVLLADQSALPDEVAARVSKRRARQLADMTQPGAVVTEEVVRLGRTLHISHRALTAGGWVSTVDDVTERRRIEARISHLAHHDALTGLPNRTAFHECLAGALEAAREHKPCAVLYLDLDRFKPVNDTLGHAAGDMVLRAVAERIQAQLRKHDVVARLGGDEFIVLLPDCTSAGDAAVLAERLIREISQPIGVKGLQVAVGASVGIAQAPQHGRDPDLLLRNADLALYRAKEAGRGCQRGYEPAMELVVEQRRTPERDLRRALADGEFALYFQPVVDTAADTISSFEALLRWHSKERGTVSPGEFLSFAEEIGLMPEIGDWVLRTACREAAGWPHGLKVSVNLSPTQFRLADLAERVSAALGDSGLAPERLELEMTETSMIDDVEGARAILQRLRALGVQIALDDFGTGYSSLSFLQTLPFTRIKIDRSFVRDLGVRPEAAAIVRAVAGLCGSLGVSATAEGVETEQQAALLRAEGCPEHQGYLISRPCPASEVKDWIAAFASSRSDAAIAA